MPRAIYKLNNLGFEIEHRSSITPSPPDSASASKGEAEVA